MYAVGNAVLISSPPSLTTRGPRYTSPSPLPLQVSIINSTGATFGSPDDRGSSADHVVEALVQGFVHPLGSRPKVDPYLRLFVTTSGRVTSQLQLSRDRSWDRLVRGTGRAGKPLVAWSL